jgi:ApaG protein
MNSITNNLVKISVQTFYIENASNPLGGEFLFAYRINIENKNEFPIQLLTRKWRIADPLKPIQWIEGEGVIGKQPIIQPDQVFQYESYCQLSTEIGSMRGSYTFKNLYSNELFEVNTPSFSMVYDGLLN